MRLFIRMAQPCCSLTTLKVIIARHREWTEELYASMRRKDIYSTSRRIGGVDLRQMFGWL
jgi:hypothetical protein